MSKQNNLEQMQKSKDYLSTVIAIFATAIIVGGGVYIWQKSELQSIQAEFQAQITSLQQQINQSQSPINETTDNSDNHTASEPTLSSQSLPQTCTDEEEGTPVITSLSAYSGHVGTKLEVRGCNFSGFEGDKNAWIENSQGIKGIIYGEPGSTSKLLKLTLASKLCQEDNSYTGQNCEKYLTLSPGIYKIYTLPWDKESNKVEFVIN